MSPDSPKEKPFVVCCCGIGKPSRAVFCNRCYLSLPEPLRMGLYRRPGSGYEEDYAAAVAFLEGKKAAK